MANTTPPRRRLPRTTAVHTPCLAQCCTTPPTRRAQLRYLLTALITAEHATGAPRRRAQRYIQQKMGAGSRTRPGRPTAYQKRSASCPTSTWSCGTRTGRWCTSSACAPSKPRRYRRQVTRAATPDSVLCALRRARAAGLGAHRKGNEATACRCATCSPRTPSTECRIERRQDCGASSGGSAAV